MILKLENAFQLVFRACRDESIDVQHIALWSIFTPLYSFDFFFSVVCQKIELWKKKFSIIL